MKGPLSTVRRLFPAEQTLLAARSRWSMNLRRLRCRWLTTRSEACRAAAASASASAWRLATECEARKLSTCGSKAFTPPARGAKPSQRSSGFSQISLRQDRRSRSASAASLAGSSRSSPSVISTTTAPCPSTRRDQSRLNTRRLSPIRVPPSQSIASRPQAASAASASRCIRWRVTLVSRVPKVKAWTLAQPAPFSFAAACRKCSSIRE